MYDVSSLMILIRRFSAGWLILCVTLLGILTLPDPHAANSTGNIAPSVLSAASNPISDSDPTTIHSPVLSPANDVSAPTQPEQSHTIPLVYYNQKDEIWRDLPYGEDDIGNYGCGPTVCAMLLSTLTGKTVTPADAADWAVKNGCYIPGGGSYHTLVPSACHAFGLSATEYSVSEQSELLAALQNGALVSVIMGPGHFTSTGHFILLTGVNADGTLAVADPASRENSAKGWDAEVIFSEAKSYASLWAVTPQKA